MLTRTKNKNRSLGGSEIMEFKEIVLLILIAPLLIAFLCAFIITFLQFIQLIKDVMYDIKIVIRNIMKK